MRVVIFILFMGILSLSANAISFVSDYLENSTLFLIDGTSKLYGVRLQNTGSEEIYLQLTYDDAVAKVVNYKEVYTVPAKTNLPIVFNVSAPRHSGPGDVYTVSYTVHELSGKGPGVPILLKVGKSFNVKIIEDPEKFYLSDIKQYSPQAILVLAIIALIAIKKFGIRKNKYGKIKIKKRKIIKW